LLTAVEVVLLVGASALAVFWPTLIDYIGLGAGAAVLTTILQWIIVIVMLLGAFELAYYFGPHVEQRWEWITPGGVLGVLILVGASLGFRAYLVFGDTYSETYGALAGVILMMLWMYLAALALLLGAELNCVIAHASEERKSRAPIPRSPQLSSTPGLS
jgi:membrane protein